MSWRDSSETPRGVWVTNGETNTMNLSPSQKRAIAEMVNTGEYRKVKPQQAPDYYITSRQLVSIETDEGFKYQLWLGKRGRWYEYANGPD